MSKLVLPLAVDFESPIDLVAKDVVGATYAEPMATLTYSGPVDYAVFAVPKTAQLAATLRTLLARIDLGAIELLDLEIVERDADGSAVRRPITALEAGDDFDVNIFDGAESAVLDDEDLALIAAELGDDDRAVVVVYEDRSLAEVAAQVTTAGGQLLWAGGIDVADLAKIVDPADQAAE